VNLLRLLLCSAVRGSDLTMPMVVDIGQARLDRSTDDLDHTFSVGLPGPMLAQVPPTSVILFVCVVVLSSPIVVSDKPFVRSTEASKEYSLRAFSQTLCYKCSLPAYNSHLPCPVSKTGILRSGICAVIYDVDEHDQGFCHAQAATMVTVRCVE
jgi:hypothetical protein